MCILMIYKLVFIRHTVKANQRHQTSPWQVCLVNLSNVNNVHIQADIQIFITAAGGEGKM